MSTSVRNIIVDWVRRDTVGPRNGPTETLASSEDPSKGYLSGILFPVGSLVDAEDVEQNSMEIDEDSNHSDEYLNHLAIIKPSSFGLTCTVSSDTDYILVNIQYGTYSNEKPVSGGFSNLNSADTSDSNRKRKFYRTPHKVIHKISLNGPTSNTVNLKDGQKFWLKHSVKRRAKGVEVSIFVVNGYRPPTDRKREFEYCMFQPSITLTALDRTKKIFLDDRKPDMTIDRRDAKLFELLFHKQGNFAIGHGCAVSWPENESGATSRLTTEFIPAYTVPRVEPRCMDVEGLDMETLFKIDNFTKYERLLAPLTDKYEEWIVELESKITSLDQTLQDTATEQVKECRATLSRIKRGINILSTNKNAGEAFAFANRAMWLHLSHSKWAKKNVENGKVDGLKPNRYDGKWYPFQMAFFLLNVEAIIYPDSQSRKMADLLWFPTGGGKTEAYLGIIAFALAHRRLKYQEPDYMRYGTVVIMRYTLRLLTLQQFHRAATLMCACEFIRRHDDEKWGDEPFLVGLWVGSNTTPNKLDGEYGAKNALYGARKGKSPKENNPIQIISCPWCGKKMGPYDYEISGAIKQCRVYCSNRHCEFSRQPDKECNLPVLLVDEDIYKRCPALIIGTVDKFAQIAWKWETGAIFGKVDKYCKKHGFLRSGLTVCNDPDSFSFGSNGPPNLDPPDIIIQDELHLISGPLGTLTALYETAVDILCTKQGIGPKIIASTATTRRSQKQILELFDRQKSNVFPPQGIEFGESFFAQVARSDLSNPGKTFLGVCTPSKNKLTVLGRLSAQILSCIRHLKDGMPENGLSYKDIDPYYTLVSYFNTIRDLGKASRMYDGTLPRFVDRILGHDVLGDTLQSGNRLNYWNGAIPRVELTSRVDSGEIPNILQDLGKNLDTAHQPKDLLLCTNMLSVGVDISRLGVMIVNGQPKNHSEYIQATGRIGRAQPGIVLTNYNYLRPRDLSHYENFGYYHATLHKNVESVAITPFAERARERALFGVLVAIVRLTQKKLAKNDMADKFNLHNKDTTDLLEKLRNSIKTRVTHVDKQELEKTLNDMDKMVTRWNLWASKGIMPGHYKSNTHTKAKNRGDIHYLLRHTEDSNYEAEMTIPNSLRDAESTIQLRYADDSVPSEHTVEMDS